MSNCSKKVISIHQPNYIPWLGYFYKIYLADIFVFLDDAQFSNEGMHNWHYIKTAQGLQRIKIPVKQRLGDKINEVQTRDALGWKQKHLRSLELNYKKASHFQEIFNEFSHLLLRSYPSLAAMNECFITWVCRRLGFKTVFIKSSPLKIISSREQKILDIVTVLGGTDYYSGTGAQVYQNEDNFNKKGIRLSYIQYRPFTYTQLWGGFHANVTVLDYLMNNGYNWEFIIKNQDVYINGNR